MNLVIKSKVFRVLMVFLQAALGIYLVRWVLRSSGLTINQLFVGFIDVSPIPLVLGVIFFLLTIGLRALRFRLFLAPNIPMTYLYGIALFQNAIITFVPWRIGEVSYPVLLKRDYKISINKSTATILAVRTMDLLLILIVVLFGLRKLNLESIPVSGLILVIAIIILLFILILINWPQIIRSVIQYLKERVLQFLTPKWVVGFLLLSLLIFLASVWQSMFILEAVALKISFKDLVLVNGVTLLAALIPIHPPGGWGTIDSIQVVLLDQLGYSPVLATQSILIAHTFYTMIILTGGMVGWSLRRLGQTKI